MQTQESQERTTDPFTTTQIGEVSEVDQQRIVARIMEDHAKTHAEAEAIFGEARMFLAMAAQHRGMSFVPSTHVDVGWHTFLLYTRAYQRFCQSLGMVFIHHEPSDIGNGIRGGYMRTIEYMKAHGIPYNPRSLAGKSRRRLCTGSLYLYRDYSPTTQLQ